MSTILTANFSSEDEDEDYKPSEKKVVEEPEVKPLVKSDKVSKIWEQMKSTSTTAPTPPPVVEEPKSAASIAASAAAAVLAAKKA